jgi:hypothetical protein
VYASDPCPLYFCLSPCLLHSLIFHSVSLLGPVLSRSLFLSTRTHTSLACWLDLWHRVLCVVCVCVWCTCTLLDVLTHSRDTFAHLSEFPALQTHKKKHPPSPTHTNMRARTHAFTHTHTHTHCMSVDSSVFCSI